MKIEMDDDVIHLLVLDVSGVYSKIHDEIYTTLESESSIRNKYSNVDQFQVIKVM